MLDINIVTYNRLCYLQKCIWSIIANTDGQYRIRVIDDVSTDGTREWLTEMKERGKIHDIILNGKQLGTGENFNRVIEKSGEWCVMANDDMWFKEGWLDEVKRIRDKYDDCGVVSFYNFSRLKFDDCVEDLGDEYSVIRTGLGACYLNKDSWLAADKFYHSGLMGFFTTPFCARLLKADTPRNRIYSTKYHKAIHMDYQGCKLNDLDILGDYVKHRKKNK